MIEMKQWPSRPFGGMCLHRNIPFSFLLALVLVPGLALGQPRPIRPASDHAALLHDGAVVSARHGLAYVMRPRGIDAVDLASGRVRWHSDGAAKPIGIVGDRLVAQAEGRAANRLDLVVLDARSGATRESTNIALPAGVKASVTDGPSGSFRVRGNRVDSQLAVRWEATGAAAGDAAQGYLPAEGHDAAPMVTTGAAVVDFAAPKARIQPLTAAAASAAIERPTLQELSEPAVAAGGRQWLSVDGRHVMISERASSGTGIHRHRWTVYERGSGSRLGAMPSLVSAAPFLVVGRTLYHVSPPYAMQRGGKLLERLTSLRAFDLTRGAEAWSVEVRDSSFRGPFPP